MEQMGFHSKWVGWVMECIKTVSFSITVNGKAGETFRPSRGIRQGCPLSPYLFLLCGEGFTALFNDAVSKKVLAGFRINRHCPIVSHLLFADDSVVYCQATDRDCEAFHQILETYEFASGQMVNKDKSAVYFSPNTPFSVRSRLSSSVGISVEVNDAKYLGLPMFLGHSKRDLFAYIKGRILKRLKSYKESFLNSAGLEVLVKAVLMVLPSYAMSCFRLPKTLTKQLSAEIAKFWWGSKEGECKIHWVNWKKLSRCKGKGGMGFRDLETFNKALLAKQGWKLVSGAPSLFRRLFKRKYFPHTSFWRANVSNQASWAWKSIAWARDLLCKGWRWQVHSGKDIRVWEDPWLPKKPFYTINQSTPRTSNIEWVSDLIDADTRLGKHHLSGRVSARRIQILFSRSQSVTLKEVMLKFGIPLRMASSLLSPLSTWERKACQILWKNRKLKPVLLVRCH